MAVTDELIIKIRVKAKQGAKEVQDATDKVKELGKAAKETSDVVGSSGNIINASLGKIAAGAAGIFAGWKATETVVAGVKASLDAFMQFETALVGVGKTTDISGQDLQNLGDSFQKLSERIPVSAVELANIGQAAGALGVRGAENITNFTETIAKLASATNLGSEEAAMSLKRILDVTGEGIDNVDEFASVLVALGNNFATTEKEITATATELGKAIGIFGATSAEVAGLSAAMAALGVQSALGSSVVGKSFREIDSAIRMGGEKLEQLQKITGQTGDQLKKTFETEPVKVFQSFLAGLNKIQQSGGSVTLALEKMNLSGDEINKTLPIMASRFDLVTQAVDMANKEFSNATALNQEADKAFDTTAAKLEMMKNAAVNLASDLGQFLAPAFNSIIDIITKGIKYLQGFVEGLNNFSSALKRMSFKDILSGVFEFQKLNGEIEQLTKKRNQIFEAIEALKQFGPSDSNLKKFLKLREIFGNTSEATEYLNLNQQELEGRFKQVADQILQMTGKTDNLTNRLLNFNSTVKQSTNALDKLAGKKGPPPIKTEVNTEAVQKAKKQIDEMLKYEQQILQYRGQKKTFGDDEITQMRQKLGYDIEQLDVLVRKIQADDKLTAVQRQQLIAQVEQLKNDKKQQEYLDEQAYAQEVVKRLIEEKIALAQKIEDFNTSEEQQIKNKYTAEKRILSVRQQELEKYKDIHDVSIQVIDSMKTMLDILMKEELFELRIKVLPEFGQDVARSTKSFLSAVNTGIGEFNNIFQTFIPQIPQHIRNNLSLAVGDFVSSIEGMFRQGAGLFGEGLSYLFTGFGDDIDKLGGYLQKNWGVPVDAMVKEFKSFASFASSIPEDLIKMFTPESNPTAPAKPFVEEDLPAGGQPQDKSMYAGIAESLKAGFNYGKELLNDAWDSLKSVFSFWSDITKKIFDKLPSFDKIAKDLGPIFQGVGTVIGKSVGFIADVAMKMFDPEFIQALADKLASFVEKLPQALVNAFQSLINAITKVIEKLPEIVTKLVDAMNVLLQKILDQLPTLVEKLFEAFGNIINRLPDLFGRIFDALPGILNTFLSNLPELIEKVFKSFATVIAQFIKAVPEILKTIFDNLPDIIKSIIIGLIDAMGIIAAAFIDWFVSGGAEQIIGSLIRAVPKLIVAIVNGIVNGLKKALSKIFGGFKVPDALGKLPQQFKDGVNNLAKSATQEAGQIFRVLDMKAVARGQNAAADIKNAANEANKRLGDSFKGLIAALVGAWRWIYDNIIQPLIDGIVGGWRWIYDNIITPIINGLNNFLTGFGEFITFLVNFVKDFGVMIDETFRGFIDLIGTILEAARVALESGFAWISENIIKPLGEIGQKGFTWVKENIIDKIANFKWPSFPDLSNLLSFKWPSLPALTNFTNFKWASLPALTDFTNFKWPALPKISLPDPGIQSYRDKFYNLGNDIWNGLFAGLDSFDWGKLIPGVGGGGGGGGGGVLGKVFGSTGGLATPTGFKYFAEGGPARGTDTIPAMLTPGEYVINRDAVSSLGLGTLRQLNRGQMPTGDTTVNNFQISVDISFDGMPDENFVKNKIVPQIKSEMKKASLKGELLVSKRGVF